MTARQAASNRQQKMFTSLRTLSGDAGLFFLFSWFYNGSEIVELEVNGDKIKTTIANKDKEEVILLSAETKVANFIKKQVS